MLLFSRSDEATASTPASRRLGELTQSLRHALSPDHSAPASVQGVMIRAHAKLEDQLELDRQFGDGDIEALLTEHREPLVMLLRALSENQGGTASADDVTELINARRRLEHPLDEPDANAHTYWEAMCHRLERCIANWCIANPQLVDLRGQQIEDRGLGSLEHIVAPPQPPPPCVLCGGRGFIDSTDPRRFPERCRCQDTPSP